MRVVQPFPVGVAPCCVNRCTHLAFSSASELEHSVDGIALVISLTQRWTGLIGAQV